MFGHKDTPRNTKERGRGEGEMTDDRRQMTVETRFNQKLLRGVFGIMNYEL